MKTGLDKITWSIIPFRFYTVQPATSFLCFETDVFWKGYFRFQNLCLVFTLDFISCPFVCV